MVKRHKREMLEKTGFLAVSTVSRPLVELAGMFYSAPWLCRDVLIVDGFDQC